MRDPCEFKKRLLRASRLLKLADLINLISFMSNPFQLDEANLQKSNAKKPNIKANRHLVSMQRPNPQLESPHCGGNSSEPGRCAVVHNLHD